VELVALLWALYLAQCLVHLPRGAVMFRGGRTPREGPGWRFTALRPSARVAYGERLPWRERHGEPRWRGVASPLWAMDAPGAGAAGAVFEPGLAAEADGTRVRAGGEPGLQCVSATGAEAVARAANAAAGGLAPAAGSLLADETSLARLRERAAEIDSATRWLRLELDVMAVSLLGLLPAASLAVGIEAVLWRAAPLLGGLHALGVVLFGIAHRRLLPGSGGAFALALFEVAVYPPALLRGHHKLRVEGMGRRHPAAVAVATLDGEPARDFLRRELVRAGAAEAGPLREAELRALEGVARATGTSASRLLAPPTRVDPRAVAYCPSCLCEFGRPGVSCSDCRMEVTPFSGGAESAPLA
jgi:hypothetical protein